MVVLKHCGPHPFTLTSIELAAPTHGYTSPLAQAVCFTSWGKGDVAHVCAYVQYVFTADDKQP